jgi:hypothetical protein
LIAYSKHNVDFSAAKPVVSAAQKFVIPVAAFDDADPLVYPGGTEKAGQPITDWQGNPVGAKGLVFFNQTDQCYQAAPSDGRSVIIINEVTAEQALDLREFVRGLGEPGDNLSKSSLERVVAHVQEDLGLVDIYNSTDAFIHSKMTPVRAASTGNGARPCGWFKRDDRDVCRAVFVEGPGCFEGPGATPQQIPPHGAFIVRQDVKGNPNYRMVDADVMLRTYLNVDGSPLELRNFTEAGEPPPTAPSAQPKPSGEPSWRLALRMIARLFGK